VSVTTSKRTPIANVIQFFHRSTKRGEQSQSEYQKMYDEGIQIAVKYFGEWASNEGCLASVQHPTTGRALARDS
jgi:regulator of replication initiation timing